MKKKIYYLYAKIPENIYNKKVKYLISNNHDFRWKHSYMYGLYAWTTSKKILKEFIEVRENSIYTLVKNDILDKEEYNRIKDRYSDLELKSYRYYYNNSLKLDDESIMIVSTKNEYVHSTEFNEEFIYQFGPQVSDTFPYYIFKDKIIDALDRIGYVSKYDIELGSEDDSNFANYNLGFNMTKYGHKNKVVYNNDMNNLLYLYRYFFYGNDINIRGDEEE